MTTYTMSRQHAARAHSGLFTRFMQMVELRKQRAILANLDATALSDLGISKQEAHKESQRPAWDVPCHWIK